MPHRARLAVALIAQVGSIGEGPLCARQWCCSSTRAELTLLTQLAQSSAHLILVRARVALHTCTEAARWRNRAGSTWRLLGAACRCIEAGVSLCALGSARQVGGVRVAACKTRKWCRCSLQAVSPRYAWFACGGIHQVLVRSSCTSFALAHACSTCVGPRQTWLWC